MNTRFNHEYQPHQTEDPGVAFPQISQGTQQKKYSLDFIEFEIGV